MLPVGIKLRFFRDLRPQLLGTRKRNVSENWSTLGETDYVRLEQLTRFSTTIPAVSNGQTTEWQSLSPGDVFQVTGVLNPDGDTRSLKKRQKAIVEFFKKLPNSGLVYIIQASISPLLYDCFSNYHSVRKAITQAEICFRSLHGKGALSFITLGGPDLLSVQILPSESLLLSAYETVEKLRETEIDNASFQTDHKREGHLFTKVFGTLAISHIAQVTAQKQTRSGRRSPTLSSPTLISTATVMSGHEKELVADYALSSRKISVSPGSQSLLFTFDSVADFASSHVDAMRQSPSLDKSVTDIFYSHPSLIAKTTSNTFSYQHLATEVDDFLDSMESVILHAPPCLGPGHLNELRKIFSSILHCTYRMDRVSLIRDLFPFFRTLVSILKNDVKWDSFLSEPYALESTSSELSTLLEHIWRAIRNRVELKVDFSDPVFPSTIDSGATKLLNVYTIAAWLCQELLHRHPITMDGSSPVECDAMEFGACVCAGSAGRVECLEVFSGFREHVQDSTLKRLYLLSVSGDLFFSPEYTFVHCIHEIAEYSEWIDRQWNLTLRNAINSHTKTLYDWTLQVLLRSTNSTLLFTLDEHSRAQKLPKRKREKAKADLKNLSIHLPKITDLMTVYMSDLVHSFPDQASRIRDDTNPVEFSSFLVGCFSSFSDPGFWACCKEQNEFPDSAEELCENIASLFSEPNFKEAKQIEEKCRLEKLSIPHTVLILLEQFELHRSILRECIADFAIVAFFSNARRQFKQDISRKRLTMDIGRCFSSFVESVHHWLSERGSIELAMDRLLLRWAIQYRAINGTALNHWIEDFFDSVNESWKEHEPENGSNPISIANASLESAVNRFPRHFNERLQQLCFLEDHPGNKSVSTILHESLNSRASCGKVWLPESNLDPTYGLLTQFLTCWDSKQDSLDFERVRFILLMWSKSQKLMFNTLFE